MTDTTVADHPTAPKASAPDPVPSPRTPQPINVGHVVASGITTTSVAGVLFWVLHWPIQAPNLDTCLQLANLLVAVVGGVTAFVKARS